jgi:GTPase SAR1 family protein
MFSKKVHETRVIFIGNTGSGKTQLIRALANQRIRETQKPTIGIDHREIARPAPYNIVGLLDTAGNPLYDVTRPAEQYQNADAVAIIIDASSSIEIQLPRIRTQLAQVRAASPKACVHLILNKDDLDEKPGADEVDLKFLNVVLHITDADDRCHSCSAKTKTGIPDLLTKLATSSDAHHVESVDTDELQISMLEGFRLAENLRLAQAAARDWLRGSGNTPEETASWRHRLFGITLQMQTRRAVEQFSQNPTRLSQRQCAALLATTLKSALDEAGLGSIEALQAIHVPSPSTELSVS